MTSLAEEDSYLNHASRLLDVGQDLFLFLFEIDVRLLIQFTTIIYGLSLKVLVY
jgi:hypothetical protein